MLSVTFQCRQFGRKGMKTFCFLMSVSEMQVLGAWMMSSARQMSYVHVWPFLHYKDSHLFFFFLQSLPYTRFLSMKRRKHTQRLQFSKTLHFLRVTVEEKEHVHSPVHSLGQLCRVGIAVWWWLWVKGSLPGLVLSAVKVCLAVLAHMLCLVSRHLGTRQIASNV